MKTTLRAAFIFTLGATIGFADLTTSQKLADFNQLAAMYAKRYAPYEWKRDAIGFDLFNIQPWLDKAAKTTSDLDFYELCIEYVSSLNDAHDVFTIPSNFVARLGFSVDLYDGITLIDTITRSLLPADKYPFQIGDELVSIDGRTTTDMLPGLLKYQIAANERSTRRLAAQLLTTRSQSRMPHAADIADSATVVIRRQSGELETYTIPWTKTGTPLLSAGSPISPYTAPALNQSAASPGFDPDTSDDFDPEYLDTLKQLWNVKLPENPVAVLSFGALAPIYTLPTGFKTRLGGAAADEFVTGTFQSGGYTIGYIRIPSYGPASTGNAIRQFQTEVAFLQQNSDGLVIDEMRNPGGLVCYGETLVSYLVPGNWRPLGFAVRATQSWIAQFASSLQQAKDQKSAQWVIDIYAALLSDVQQAYSENRGMTGALPLCTVSLDRPAAKDAAGKVIAYTKPLIVLTDEMSASGADAFPAMLQDAQRGPIVGWRTMGAGGNVIDVGATTYSGGNTRVTESLMIRRNPVMTPDFPAAPYVENIGVRPDIQIDYMTRDNLLQKGKPFVDAFTQVIVDQIKKLNSSIAPIPSAF